MYTDIPIAINSSHASKNVEKLARDLLCERPDVGALVIKCTVMEPYSRAIDEAMGCPFTI